MDTNRYLFKATVTIRQGRQATTRSETDLVQFSEQCIEAHLTPLALSCSHNLSYYYPDEDAEMNGVDHVELNLRIERECKRFRSVVDYSQIVRALCDLFDGVGGMHISCILEEPRIISPCLDD